MIYILAFSDQGQLQQSRLTSQLRVCNCPGIPKELSRIILRKSGVSTVFVGVLDRGTRKGH